MAQADDGEVCNAVVTESCGKFKVRGHCAACRLYPYIITADIMAAWTAQVRDGASLDWPMQAREEQLSRHARQSHAASGAFGASSSFGGGGSSGGAGGSGSW
jgi:uncharacterized membrane protein YgcG